MKTAYYLGKVNKGNCAGEQRLYRLEPPLIEDHFDGHSHHQYVVASAAIVPLYGPETYIFPADENGTITDWGELDGSKRGVYGCDKVIRDLGYRITKQRGS